MLNESCKRCGSPVETNSGGYYFCKLCGHADNVLKNITTSNRTSAKEKTQDFNSNNTILTTEYNPFSVNYDKGWICPKCGSVMGPNQKYCVKCTQLNNEITY